MNTGFTGISQTLSRVSLETIHSEERNLEGIAFTSAQRTPKKNTTKINYEEPYSEDKYGEKSDYSEISENYDKQSDNRQTKTDFFRNSDDRDENKYR